MISFIGETQGQQIVYGEKNMKGMVGSGWNMWLYPIATVLYFLLSFSLCSRYKGRSFRGLVEICKSIEEVPEYLRNMCIKLECCPNLVSQKYVETECPENCAMLTKTKYSKYRMYDTVH